MEVRTITSLREVVARFTELLRAHELDCQPEGTRTHEGGVSSCSSVSPTTQNVSPKSTADDFIMESINLRTVCRRMTEAPRFSDLEKTDVHHFMSVLGLDDTCDHTTAACIYRTCYAAYCAHSTRAAEGDAANIQMRVHNISRDDGGASLESKPHAMLRLIVPEIPPAPGTPHAPPSSSSPPSPSWSSSTDPWRQQRMESETGDGEDATDTVDFKREIFEFYRRYAAHRLRKNGVNIPQIAQKYDEQRDMLNKRLKNIYGANLDTMAMRRRRPLTNTNIDIMDRLQFWSLS